MIHLEHTPAPSEFLSRASEAFERLEQTASAGGYKTQQRFKFESIWHGFRAELAAKSFGKCVYCESLISLDDDADVDHFRPRSRAEGLGKGNIDPDHYWWLAYEWGNIAMSCRRCNRAKRNRFPVRGNRINRGDPISSEDALLIDPFGTVEPLEHLWFGEDGTVRPASDEGEATIRVLDLDRPDLRRRREKKAMEITERARSGELDATVIEQLTAPQSEYAGLARQVVARLRTDLESAPTAADTTEQAMPGGEPTDLAARADLDSSVLQRPEQRPVAPAEMTVSPASIWIDSVELVDFGCIRNLDLRFGSPQAGREPWIVLLGSNGVGKSTILKAIALALASEDDRTRLLPSPSRFVRHGAPAATVTVRFNDESEVNLRINRHADDWSCEGARPQFGLVAYGSTRLLRRSPTRAFEQATGPTLSNLFDPFVPLADAEPWLADTSAVPSDDFKVLATQLKTLLSIENDVELTRRSGQLYARLFGERQDLDLLSDGYQSVLALALDLSLAFGGQMGQGMSTENFEGMVLIDELEVHLHPEWKMRVVSDLREMFPHLQFVATTHDPLCLRGLETGEIHLLRRDVDTGIVVEQIDVPSGLDADEILTGQWFGLDTTLDPESEADLLEYRRLRLAGHAPDDPRLHDLQQRLERTLGTYTGTSLGRVMVDAAADLVAESVEASPTKLSQPQVKQRLLDHLGGQR